MKKGLFTILQLFCFVTLIYTQVTIGGQGISGTTGTSFGYSSYVKSVQNKDGTISISFGEEDEKKH